MKQKEKVFEDWRDSLGYNSVELHDYLDTIKAYIDFAEHYNSLNLDSVNKRYSIDDALSDIIDLTSSTEDDGSVWGFDTEIDSKKNLIKRAKEILLNV